MNKVESILARFGSLMNGKGGDVFFKGISKQFGPNPIIPKGNQMMNRDIHSYLHEPKT